MTEVAAAIRLRRKDVHIADKATAIGEDRDFVEATHVMNGPLVASINVWVGVAWSGT